MAVGCTVWQETWHSFRNNVYSELLLFTLSGVY